MVPHVPQPARPNALSRGLRLLEAVSVADAPLRFSDCRELLPGIGDSTLARLLQGLETEGYLERAEGEGYAPGPALREWRGRLTRQGPDFPSLAREAVAGLVRAADESAAVCLLEGDRIVTVTGHSVPGGIQVMRPGDTLHFEADHAAALVILQSLSPAARRRLLAGPHSQIADESAYAEGLAAARWEDGLCRDQSRLRPGVSRIARGFRCRGQPGAVFYCVTTERARRSADLALALESAAGHLSRD